MNEKSAESQSLSQLQFLAHVETIIRDRVCAAIKQHELEKSHVLSGYERDIGDLRTRCAELEELIRSGFPQGDLSTHCKVHQGYIDDVVDRRKRISAVIAHATNASVIGGGLLLMNALWDYIKAHLK